MIFKLKEKRDYDMKCVKDVLRQWVKDRAVMM